MCVVENDLRMQVGHHSGSIQDVTSVADATDPAFSRLEKAAIVAQSNITFPQEELLIAIEQHLQSKGLFRTAHLLRKEAV